MKICELKIQKKFYDLIESGEKKFEVRKTDKKYIQDNDIIMFKDLDDRKTLGFAMVIYSQTLTTKAANEYNGLDKKTKKFIEENYKDISKLFIMRIEHIKTYQGGI